MQFNLKRRKSLAFFSLGGQEKHAMDETVPRDSVELAKRAARSSSGLFRRTSHRVLSALKIGRGASGPQTPPVSPQLPSTCQAKIAINPVTASRRYIPLDVALLSHPAYSHGLLTPPSSPPSLQWPAIMLDGKSKSQPNSNNESEPKDVKLVKSATELRRPLTSARPGTPALINPFRRPLTSPRTPTTATSTQSDQRSSPYGSGVLPRSKASTAQTTPMSSASLSSGGTVRRTSSSKRTSASGSVVMERIEEHKFPQWIVQPQDETLQEPGIKTVELTSAVKVFFEHEYRQDFDATPRAQRFAEFKHLISRHRMFIGKAREIEITQVFHQSESNYLRHMRLLKSRRLTNKNCVQNAVADFEVVRVLGKGSFGIVRLVRKKKSFADGLDGTGGQPNLVSDDAAVSVNMASGAKTPFNRAMQKPSLFYAMKVIRKSAMLRSGQESHLRAERDFLILAKDSRWVVPLEAAFQDNTNLYLVMEYMIGGDFLGLLLREDILEEGHAAFYVAEMILCLEESHKLGWIHRDVKPDNFLIDARGHLKISDFGLSFDGDWSHNQAYYSKSRSDAVKATNLPIHGDSQDVEEAKTDVKHDDYGQSRSADPETVQGKEEARLQYFDRVRTRRFAQSVVGTSQYMAPEVIRGDQYDGRCDWWSVGIILYECLYGRTPFYCESRLETKTRILKHHKYLGFPAHTRWNRPTGDEKSALPPVSNLALDFMCRLLRERHERLSCSSYKRNDLVPMQDAAAHGFSSKPNVATLPNEPSLRHRSSSNSHRACTFVYPDSARDIKRHEFFKEWNIDFSRIHEQEPPFRPRIRDEDSITKYFDDEGDIISDDEAELYGSSDDSHLVESLSPGYSLSLSSNGKGKRPLTGPNWRAFPLPPNKLEKDKKRPRDKILRDVKYGETAMALRKRRAFIGYTYRRPHIAYPPIARLTVANQAYRSYCASNTRGRMSAADLSQPKRTKTTPVSQQRAMPPSAATREQPTTTATATTTKGKLLVASTTMHHATTAPISGYGGPMPTPLVTVTRATTPRATQPTPVPAMPHYATLPRTSTRLDTPRMTPAARRAASATDEVD